MSRTHVMTCDRCGREQASDKFLGPMEGWHTLQFQLGRGNAFQHDLCSSCHADYTYVVRDLDHRLASFLFGAPKDAAVVGTRGEWSDKADEVTRGT